VKIVLAAGNVTSATPCATAATWTTRTSRALAMDQRRLDAPTSLVVMPPSSAVALAVRAHRRLDDTTRRPREIHPPGMMFVVEAGITMRPVGRSRSRDDHRRGARAGSTVPEAPVGANKGAS
jgi:hypothetical protein